jgi:3-isopropylmalate dehydratase small subunit
MQPFTRLQSKAINLPERDVDTDIIFPARFLLITDKDGLGRYAFYERRYDGDGAPRPDFPLNQARNAGAQILVVGANFGCGSSREHAVWALEGLGVRCIISDSFGEIFYSNCFKSGVLPVVVAAPVLADLAARAERGEVLAVDLKQQSITVEGGAAIAFETEEWRRQALLNGWDEVTTILNTKGDAIAAFETAQRRSSSWLYAEG